MNRLQLLDRFQLDENLRTHDDVGTVAAIEAHFFVPQGQRSLPVEGDAAGRELMAKAVLVDRFEQTRAEVTVNLDARPYDCLRERIGLP